MDSEEEGTAQKPASQQGAPLDSIAAERLVTLRLLLAEAKDRSHDSSVAGRHVAILMLQNVCEQAMIVGLADLGQSHTERDSFDDLYSRLAGVVTDQLWKRSNNWSLVRQMNHARNGSHHHGTIPDHGQLIDWSTAAERFVRSIVQVIFDRELLDVVLSDLIDNEELRGRLAVAEKSLSDDDPVASIQSSMSALAAARQIWRGQRKPFTPPLPWTDVNQLIPQQFMNALSDLDDADEVRPFAADMGTYAWVREVRDHAARAGSWSGAPVSAHDAQRVLSFVFRWVLSWQTFSSTFDIGRSMRLRAVPPPRVSDTPERGARLLDDDVTVHRAIVNHAEGPIANSSVELYIVDAPTVGFQGWLRDLNSELRARELSARVDPSGVVHLQVTADTDADSMVSRVRAAMTAAEMCRAARVGAVADWPESHVGADGLYRVTLLSLSVSGCSVFDEVELMPASALSADSEPPGFVVTARLTHEMMELVPPSYLYQRLAGSRLTHRSVGALNDAEPAITIPDSVKPEEAAEVIAAIITETISVQIQEKDSQRQWAEERTATERKFAQALRRDSAESAH